MVYSSGFSAYGRRVIVAPLVLCAFFLAAALPIIWIQLDNTRAGVDQNAYHLQAVHKFASQWPRPDLAHYLSATTPGYHLVLAAFEHFVSGDPRVLRLVGSLFTVGLLATFGWSTASRVGAGVAIALGLPLVASLYVFSSGAWLLPDNAGWCGVLLVLLIAIRPRHTPTTYVCASIVLVGVVLMRQVHIWCAALLWYAAWVSAEQPQSGGDGHVLASKANETPGRARVVLSMVLATLPAFAVLGMFVGLWHGLTQSTFTQQEGDPNLPRSPGHQAINLAMPALVLSLTGIYSLFCSVPLLARVRQLDPRRIAVRVLCGAAVGAVAGIVPPTVYSMTSGRSSGLWNVTPMFPAIGQHSLLIVGLSILGGIALSLWTLALRRRDAAIGLAGWIFFTVAHTANGTAWQRYVEPFLLIWIGLLAVRLPTLSPPGNEAPAPTSIRRGLIVGQLMLTVLLAAITCAALRRPFYNANDGPFGVGIPHRGSPDH